MLSRDQREVQLRKLGSGNREEKLQLVHIYNTVRGESLPDTHVQHVEFFVKGILDVEYAA
jgi:hypothetical protein